jgi:nicotinamide-nucleotide adenylyltransferase
MTTAAISDALGRLQDRASPTRQCVEVLHTPQPEWPLRSIAEPPNCLRLSVLDSSFNPPTLAHAALAMLAPPNHTEDSGSISSPLNSYDAHLLLLSVTNADKARRPGDAGLEQRLEMMTLLAKELQPSGVGYSASNVAVAAIDEPTFVGKARQLGEFLRDKIRSDLELSKTSEGGGTAPSIYHGCSFTSLWGSIRSSDFSLHGSMLHKMLCTHRWRLFSTLWVIIV